MNSRKWIKIWFILLVSFILLTFFFIFFLHNYKNVPLRFTNSISFDAKLSFLNKSNTFNNAEILIVGSSMGLNNINSEIISKGLNKNVLNISSWGMKVNQVYSLLKLLDLSKVKTVIYLNQYFDLYSLQLEAYNEKEIKEYLYENNSIPGYLNTFSSLSSKFKDYLEWKKRYLDNKKYSSLLFNNYGDIQLLINEENSSLDRWNAITDITNNKEQFKVLEEVFHYLEEKGIEFYSVTTPYRNSFLENDEFIKQYDPYVKKSKILSDKFNFSYINLQNSLNLEDEYFADSSHLNYKGGNLVSKELIKYLSR